MVVNSLSCLFLKFSSSNYASTSTLETRLTAFESEDETYLGTINTLSTSPIMSLEITSLNHKSRDNPMEMSSLVFESFG
jgi:uncharacterized protein YqfB (UPF0267 family)